MKASDLPGLGVEPNYDVLGEPVSEISQLMNKQMNKGKIKIGFIGAGYMGYGIALNLVNNYNLTVFAHKNRKPIDDLVQKRCKRSN